MPRPPRRLLPLLCALAAALLGARGLAADPADDSAPAVLLVVGMQDEAQVAAGPGLAVVVGGGDANHLRALLHGVDRTRLRAVISFGVAGALHPALHPGDVVVATRVLSSRGAWLTDAPLTASIGRALAARGVRVREGPFFGSDDVVATPGERLRLRRQTGAVASDMESHVAAAFAAEAHVPFAVVRTISDGAREDLPPAMLHALRLDGSVDVGAVLASLAGEPAQLPRLVRASKEYGRALAALRRCRASLDGVLRR